MSDESIYVTALGLSHKEQITLDYILKLSSCYRLVPKTAPRIDLVLVNIDVPNTVLYWKSHLSDAKQQAIIVSEHVEHLQSLVYLGRRFIARPCFAKQVLAALDRARQHDGVVTPASVDNVRSQPGIATRLATQLRQAKKTARHWLHPLRNSARELQNPYYS